MKRILALVAAVVAVLAGTMVSQPAFASTPGIIFDAPGYDSAYASPWLVGAQVSVDSEGSVYTLDPGAGRVDFYLDGGVTAYAAAVPIREDGRVYVAQRSDQPYLAPGPHSLRAVFTPNENTGWPTVEATTTLTVSALDLAAEIRIVGADTESAQVAVKASGTAVDAFAGMPAGVWTITATTAGAEPVVVAVAQAQGSSDEITVDLEDLAAGTAYSATAAFAPHDSLAEGITIADSQAETFSTTSTGFVGALQSSVPTAPWIVGAGVGVLVILLALVIVFAVRRRRTVAEPEGPTLGA